jgi:DNA-binding MarR family transcriptional regulator
MRRAARKVSDFYNSIMEGCGLHANQFTLLIPIYLAPALTINQLAHYADLDRTTLARNLKVLEKRGLISIRAGDDQRTRVVQITDLGRRTLLNALPLWEKAQEQFTNSLGEPYQAEFLDLLDQLDMLLPADSSQ